MPVCCGCGIEKPVQGFPPTKGSKKGYQSRCRPCYSVYQRDYYRNRTLTDPAYRKRKKAWRRDRQVSVTDRNRAAIWDYFKDHPCVDCGEFDPVVLEFDHVDPTLKSSNISNIVPSVNLQRLFDEIKKCEVRCANCHRRKTAKQQGWYQREKVLR